MDATMRKYIAADPQICHGKPCFRGTRIPVYLILELLEAGVKPEEIVGPRYYPSLTLKHIRAALHFAARSAENQSYTAFEKTKR